MPGAMIKSPYGDLKLNTTEYIDILVRFGRLKQTNNLLYSNKPLKLKLPL